MSKCIVSAPLSRVKRIGIVFGGGRSMSQVKAASGCDWIINGGLYDFGTGKPVFHLRAGGKTYAQDDGGAWGYAWDVGPDILMTPVPADRKANYIACLALLTPWDGINAKLAYDKAALGGVRGRSAMAVGGGKLILYCSGDGTADGKTPEGLRQELYDMGAETALMLDSGGSSQCDFGGGQSIYSSRRVNNYICVWLKKDSQDGKDKEDKPVDKHLVCLDPGHGPDTVNGSPDGTYKEKEFTWDMYKRLRPLLEANGIEVICTRAENEKPSLTARAAVSNKAGADLFVSLHSNASGDGGWTAPRGLMIYTSVAGDSAGRNRAAKAILARMKEAGVTLFGSGLEHNPEYTVLRTTTAPAMIVEHGFHTNREDTALLKDSAYRDKLAEAECMGICDYLGVAWKGGQAEGKPADAPAAWAAEAWRKAKEKGIMDGTRPAEGITRQELAVVLDRLGLI